MKPEGVRCVLTMTITAGPNKEKKTIAQEILVKPRPNNEMALLEEWYRNTPKEYFPSEKPALARSYDKGKSNIRFSRFDLRSYDPWLFIRVGNRKPSVPNNPRTLAGWRELEASLAPSTMRDEVRLTRLRLEYFAATDRDVVKYAKSEYNDWLDKLPAPQRDVMRAYSHWSVCERNCRFIDRYRELERDRYNDLAFGFSPGCSMKNSSPVSRVVVIGVGGGGTYFRDSDAPNFERIFEEGAIGYDVRTSYPTTDSACWASILHGVRPLFHQRSDSVAQSRPYPKDDKFPSIFRMIRYNLPEAQLASFCTWDPINAGMIEEGLNVVKVTAKSDEEVTARACEYIASNDPTLLFVQFSECDQVGHDKGFGSAEQLSQIAATDELIQRIYEAYESRDLLDSTLFVVVTDHGGVGTEHGGDSAEESNVTFAAAGPGVEAGTVGEMGVYDVPRIIFYALGLSAWEKGVYWEGRVPSHLFKGKFTSKREDILAQFYRHGYRNGPALDKSPTSSPVATLGVPEKLRQSVRAYFPFEADHNSAIGDVETTSHVEEGFIDGYWGYGIKLQLGWLTLENAPLNKKSFSIGFWLKTNYIEGEPRVVSVKGGTDEDNAEFSLALSPPNASFCVKRNDDRGLIEFPLPKDYYDGWTYVVLAVDREKNVVRLSYDFEDFTSVELGPEFADLDLGSASTLTIGDEEDGNRLNAVIDELLLLDGAISETELPTLKNFYTERSLPQPTL